MKTCLYFVSGVGANLRVRPIMGQNFLRYNVGAMPYQEVLFIKRKKSSIKVAYIKNNVYL